MKTVVNNTLIHFVDIGISTAQPVVFIHGFPFNHKMWMFPGGQTEAIASTHRVVAYDVRGHGESEVGDALYTIEFFVDDLIGLMDHLNIRAAVLVGLSMGGYIALRAVERHPDRVRALVLSNTKAEADSNEGRVKRSAAIRAIRQNGPKVFAQTFVAGAFAPDTFNAKPDAVKAIQSTIERTAPAALCATLLALAARTDSTPGLPNIKVPTLILAGEHDAIATPADAELMRSKIPGAELSIIPHAAHLSNIENPEDYNKHLTAFLAKL